MAAAAHQLAGFTIDAMYMIVCVCYRVCLSIQQGLWSTMPISLVSYSTILLIRRIISVHVCSCKKRLFNRDFVDLSNDQILLFYKRLCVQKAKINHEVIKDCASSKGDNKPCDNFITRILLYGTITITQLGVVIYHAFKHEENVLINTPLLCTV